MNRLGDSEFCWRWFLASAFTVRNARITFTSCRSNSAWSFSQPTKLAATRLVISAFLPPW